jgi:hypothetical protein
MSRQSLGGVTLVAVVVAGVALFTSAAARPIVLEESAAVMTPGGDRSTATTVWFQGFLADDATGDPVNAAYNIVAWIYSAAGGGSLLWGPETHNAVTITEGWFNIELGSLASPLPAFASPPYYLQLQVNGETLTPRLKLASVPSAIQSATSDLLPFSGVYAGSSNGITLIHNGSNSADAISVTRVSSTSGAYAIYATSGAPTAVMRGYQTTASAVTTAPVLDLDISNAANASAVINANTTGTGAAYYGTSDGLYGAEVYADGSDGASADDAHVIHAVYNGADRSGDNVAVYGEALDDAWGIGGDFVGDGYGVRGTAVPSSGGSVFSAGVAGYCSTPNTGYSVGVYGKASGGSPSYAGLFDGAVDVNGTLSKNAGSFKIDHPLDPANKYLSHSFVESPDMMNIYNGNAELDAAGEAWVELPEWFEALNQDFRYQLTCIGAFAPVYIADEIVGNRFRIAGGEPGLSVSWQVTGIRHDPYADAHRIPVEEMKPAREQGRYRNPELYGQPVSAGVLYDERMAKTVARETARGGRKTEPEAPEGVDPANQ